MDLKELVSARILRIDEHGRYHLQRATRGRRHRYLPHIGPILTRRTVCISRATEMRAAEAVAAVAAPVVDASADSVPGTYAIPVTQPNITTATVTARTTVRYPSTQLPVRRTRSRTVERATHSYPQPYRDHLDQHIYVSSYTHIPLLLITHLEALAEDNCAIYSIISAMASGRAIPHPLPPLSRETMELAQPPCPCHTHLRASGHSTLRTTARPPSPPIITSQPPTTTPPDTTAPIMHFSPSKLRTSTYPYLPPQHPSPSPHP